jgi:hypothetical protein
VEGLADTNHESVNPTFGVNQMARYGIKHPKTHAEMAISVDPEITGLVRTKRKGRNLPDAYDDKPVGRRARSWKAHRKTKWKA